jgi:ribosome recycling factor
MKTELANYLNVETEKLKAEQRNELVPVLLAALEQAKSELANWLSDGDDDTIKAYEDALVAIAKAKESNKKNI